METSGSLQDLNPIVLPDPVGLLPLAPGWQLLLAVIAALALWQAWKYWLKRRANVYRREALRELDQVTHPQAIPDLLKRAALSAYRRQDIAALTGTDWHRFLDRSAGMTQFGKDCGQWLDQAAYGDPSLTAQQFTALRGATKTWLIQHHELPPVNPGREFT